MASCSSDLVLEKLCSILSQTHQLSIPLVPAANLYSPSPLLASLIRAACFIDLASAKKEASTQTDSVILTSKEKHDSEIEEKDDGHGHKKRKRKKESRSKKKKKEKRRKKHYCSSPTYDDYEPENPILRRRLRAKVAALKKNEEQPENDKGDITIEKEKKKRKRKRRSRSESLPRSKTRSRSKSSKRKSRSKERKRKKKKRKRSQSLVDDETALKSQKDEKEETGEIQNHHEEIPEKKKKKKVAKIEWEKIPDENEKEPDMFDNLHKEVGQDDNLIVEDNPINNGNIIFSKIEDIPTRTDSPKWFENESMKKKAFHEVKIVEAKKKDTNTSRLKFEINFPQKRLPLATPTASTFAELSNKLGPTHNLNSRKMIPKHLLNELKETLSSAKAKPEKTVVKPQDPKVAETEPEIVHIEDVNGNRSRSYTRSRSRSRSGSRSYSRSYSRSRSRSFSYYSHSRSRSYSYSSYSRSRSRSRSYSRSRSRSYSSYSSRSRSRSRSPSIVRRRGSPSFLDKRRITSARKRPIPYHRPTPSPSPSCSSGSSYSGSRSRSRSRSKSPKDSKTKPS